MNELKKEQVETRTVFALDKMQGLRREVEAELSESVGELTAVNRTTAVGVKVTEHAENNV